jgi:hypothetical protein
MLYWTPNNTTKKSGAQTKKWISLIEEDANELKMNATYMRQLTSNRIEWKKHVNALCK